MTKSQIIQWNCRGFYSNISNIIELNDKYQPAVLALQELILGQRKKLSLRGYRPLSSTGREGAGLLIRNDVPFSEIRLQTTIQAVAAIVDIGKQYTICSAYLSPNVQITYEEMQELLQQLPTPVIVLGDLNARDPTWGDNIMNPRATQIKRLLEEFDLGILNTGESTHYHSQTNTYSCIDLSLISTECYTDIAWRVINPSTEPYDSDYFPIILEKVNGNTYHPSPERFNLAKADWGNFKTKTLMEIEEQGTVNEINNKITSKIMEAAKESIPVKRQPKKIQTAPYWNEECEAAKRNKKQLQRRMLRNKSQLNRIEYNRARAQERKCINEARKATWQKYVSTINTNTTCAEVWRKIKKISGKCKAHPIPVIRDGNGIIQTKLETVAEILGNTIAQYSNGENYTQDFQTKRRLLERNEPDFPNQDTEYNAPFTEKELRDALNKCKDTSPGPDNVQYAMIRNLHPSATDSLLYLYNRVWDEGVIPEAWRTATVIPIKKEGKDGLDPTHYRPISLTSCLCKLMERMVSMRLQWYLEKENIISNRQFGFRKGHSTADPLLMFQHDINQAFNRKSKILAVSFDLEKAYDTTWKWNIKNILHTIGLRGSLPKFLSDLLKNRKFRVRIGKHLSQEKELIEGLPQGAVESCDLFKLAINDITKEIPTNVKYSMYVDDILIYVEGRNLNSMERRIQNAINKIAKWAENHGYRFSNTKTKAIIFSRRERAIPSLKLYNQEIPTEKEIKFLGLTFDSRLTWSSHIKRIKKECQSPMTLLRHLSHLNWGADKRTLEIMYKTLIQSKITYACEVFGNEKTGEAMNKIQNEALRIISGAFKSSPIKSMQVDSQILPYDLQILQNSCRHYIRNKPNTTSITREMIEESFQEQNNWRFKKNIQKVLGDAPETSIKVQSIIQGNTPPWKMTRTRICNGIEKDTSKNTPMANAMLFREHLQHHRESVQIYTDGSKNERGVGCAVTIPALNQYKLKALPNEASIYTAEAEAILEALGIIEGMEYEHYTIFSDSRSVLKTLESTNPRNTLIQSLKEKIHSIENEMNKKVTICWSPAHVGIRGNEKGDEMAKRASEMTPTEIDLPFSDYIPAVKRKILAKWQLRWDEEVGNKLHSIRPSIRKWESAYHKRRYETIMTRLRMGHCNFSHLHLMKRENQPRCCNEPLTVKHALASCRLNHAIRENLYPGINNLTISERMVIMLREDKIFDVEKLMRFLKETGLYNKI